MTADPFELLQVPSELEPVLDIYRAAAPARVLEIGCWDGGTIREWLLNGHPELLLAVDLNHRNQDAYQAWVPEGTELRLFTGNSQSIQTKQAIRDNAPYDWVFVDGDHSDYGARNDVHLCLPLIRPGGLLVLHDISPETGLDSYPPGDIADELEAAGHDVRRFVDSTPMPWAHGLAVIQC